MKTLAMMFGSSGIGGAKLMAEALRRMGRRGDTVLAHITPEEADMLMQAGGAGTINPDTGLPEFAPRRSSDFDDAGDFVRNTESNILRSIRSQPVSGTARTESVPIDTDFERFDVSARPETYTPVGNRMDLMSYGTSAPNVRTGGFTPEPMDVTSDLGVYGVRPGGTALRMPDRDIGLTTRALSQAPEPYFSSLAQLRPLEDRTALARRQPEGFAERAESGLQELRDVLDRYPNLTRAGTAGANILAQTLLFNQANQEMRRGVEEARRAAVPFREAQAEAMGRATGEGLTPEQQQELEIEQARARQGLTERNLQTGSAAAGVLAAQTNRARSLARKSSFDEALRLANIADQYDRRALEMELQRDQQLAQLFAGILSREVQQAQRTQAPVPETGR
jgi:hypothetical protein